jgi:EAL domain-containing protein (putative c-di-GMP-specific phosphodiesterase class I)
VPRHGRDGGDPDAGSSPPASGGRDRLPRRDRGGCVKRPSRLADTTRAMKAAIRTESLLVELDAILGARLVHSLYQPVVDLQSGRVVAYEALARGPQGSPLEHPANLFEAARRAGRLSELDWVCRTAAADGALEAGLRAPLSLLVNVEPQAMHKPDPPGLKQSWRRACERFRIVLEVKERALTDGPAGLLWSIGWARDLGFEIALDAAGGDSRSPSLLALLDPEVVKIDLRLLRARAPHDRAALAHAVAAHAERTGAAVVAQGIENDADVDLALATGATRGQGWRFGIPSALPGVQPQGGGLHEARPSRALPAGLTPFDLLRDRRPVRRSTKTVLRTLSRHLEDEALVLPEPPVVIGAFQDERFLTDATRDVYVRLGRAGAFVVALGSGMSPVPAPGVRGVSLGSRDPLRDQWVVVVMTPHFSAALVGADAGDHGDDSSRRFDHVVTYDHDLVDEIARSLLPRVLAA